MDMVETITNTSSFKTHVMAGAGASRLSFLPTP
jgi:hypothetical protein